MKNKTKMKFASGILVVLVIGLVFILANGIGFNAESLENTENIVYENDKHEEESFDIINTENNNESDNNIEPEVMKPINFIPNPLPLPKKHVKKEMNYAFEPSSDMMHYDYNNYRFDDDYDLKDI